MIIRIIRLDTSLDGFFRSFDIDIFSALEINVDNKVMVNRFFTENLQFRFSVVCQACKKFLKIFLPNSVEVIFIVPASRCL